jgi:hypothetical protein
MCVQRSKNLPNAEIPGATHFLIETSEISRYQRVLLPRTLPTFYQAPF